MTYKKPRPFKIAEELLETMLLRAIDFGAFNDYEEQFSRIAEERGRVRAHHWYALQIFLLFPSFIFQSIYWDFTMLKIIFSSHSEILKSRKCLP